MNQLQVLVFSVLWLLLLLPMAGAGDLSQYREFDLNSGLDAIALQAVDHSDGTTMLHDRPSLIQRLLWRADSNDSVKEIEFNFLNGELYRLMVRYSRYSTEGLTVQDVIDATSEIYGEAKRPKAEITIPITFGRDETVEVIALWEDSEWAYNLVQFQYETALTLIVLSKRLEGPAGLAIDRAIALDAQEAPQREIDKKKETDLTKAADLAKARMLNRPRFRP